MFRNKKKVELISCKKKILLKNMVWEKQQPQVATEAKTIESQTAEIKTIQTEKSGAKTENTKEA